MGSFFKNKRYIVFMLLVACGGAALAYVSDNFTLGRFIASFSTGGIVSSSESEMKVVAGEGIVGMTSSSGYTISAGFMGGAVPSSLEEPENGTPEGLYVYPNPCRPGSGGDYDADALTFANLPDIDRIKILNLAGEVVNTIDETPEDGKIIWEPRNKTGRRLASGVYIYYITTTDGKTESGKFSIIY